MRLKQSITQRVTNRGIVIGTSIAIAAGVTVSISGNGRVLAQAATPAASPDPGTVEFYKQRVEPILDDNCYSCHQESLSGGLRLDTYAGLMKGGKSGPPIVPGDPETSLMITLIRRTGKIKMPPKHALEEAEIADLVAWV